VSETFNNEGKKQGLLQKPQKNKHTVSSEHARGSKQFARQPGKKKPAHDAEDFLKRRCSKMDQRKRQKGKTDWKVKKEKKGIHSLGKRYKCQPKGQLGSETRGVSTLLIHKRTKQRGVMSKNHQA